MPEGELVTAGCVSVVYVCKFCVNCQAVSSVISDLLDLGVRMGWTVSKKFGLLLSHRYCQVVVLCCIMCSMLNCFFRLSSIVSCKLQNTIYKL
jgi:hypothetical protein